MNRIFQIVADTLDWIASLTGFSYEEINIIAYYILLPLIYVALVDRILKKHYLKIAYIAAWAIVLACIPKFSVFADILFQRSVDFLLLFGHIGLDYVAASVVICLILPGLVFVVLLLFAFPTLRRKLCPPNAKQPAA